MFSWNVCQMSSRHVFCVRRLFGHRYLAVKRTRLRLQRSSPSEGSFPLRLWNTASRRESPRYPRSQTRWQRSWAPERPECTLWGETTMKDTPVHHHWSLFNKSQWFPQALKDFQCCFFKLAILFELKTGRWRWWKQSNWPLLVGMQWTFDAASGYWLYISGFTEVAPLVCSYLCFTVTGLLNKIPLR